MSWKNSPCLESRLKPNTNGYVSLIMRGTSVKAHQIMYRLFVGTVRRGKEIDHLCRNRKCVNPLHLEAVTKAENILRGEGFSAKNKRKTHCNKGHPLSGENLLWKRNKKGEKSGRICRICGNEMWRLAKQKARRIGTAAWLKK